MRKTDIFLFFIFLSFCCRPVYPQNKTENPANQLKKINSCIQVCEILESEKMPEVNPLTINAKYQNIACQSGIALAFTNLNQEDMAKFYAANKKQHKAISFAKRAEEVEKQLSMPYIGKNIYRSLFNSYIEANKKDSSKYYLKLYTALNDSLVKSERESAITPVKRIISDQNRIRNLFISDGILPSYTLKI